jgi:hypothetical protein
METSAEALIRSSNAALTSLAASAASLDRTTQATLTLQRRFGWVLSGVCVLVGLVLLASAWLGVMAGQYQRENAAQVRQMLHDHAVLMQQLTTRQTP